MKRLIPFALLFPTLLTNVGGANLVNASAQIKGGTISFNFANQTDLDKFDMYSSYLSNPVVNGESICSYIYAEQKVILKDVQLDNYLIEADFAPNVYNGHIDAGFYLQASNPGNEQDHISAFNLQIKHDPDVDTWFLRLYEYRDNYFLGTIKEISNLPFWNSEWIHLSAVVDNGQLSAYINNDYSTPILTHNIGNSSGLVGFRSFRCPARFKNLSITSSKFEMNFEELDSLLSIYNELHSYDYTQTSWLDFNKVLIKAKSLRQSPTNQLDIVNIIKDLKKAYDNLVLARTYNELQVLIEGCEQIVDEESYTKNSFASFKFCLNRAKQLTIDNSIEEISLEYAMLLNRKNELIRYGGSVND